MIKRVWEIPDIASIEYLDKPEGYGVSWFWYCFQCSVRYAEARIEGRVWKGISACCLNCRGTKFGIPGTLECNATIGWEVPEAIIRYQLDREIAFLDHPDHPHNEVSQ